jgi:hypothetical protein
MTTHPTLVFQLQDHTLQSIVEIFKRDLLELKLKLESIVCGENDPFGFGPVDALICHRYAVFELAEIGGDGLSAFVEIGF